MYKEKQPVLVFALVVSIAFLIGCTPSTASPQASDTDQPGPSPINTETATQTSIPSSTTTFTLTPEPTATETPTITPSPTPNMVMPGTFYAGGCGSKSMSQGGQLDFCVTSVTVDADRHMIFAVTWKLSNIPSGFTVTKKSDQGNRNMYLIDNLGNRYNHTAGGDAAYASVVVTDGSPVSGWFDFGQPPVGAFTFDFHDDDNGIVIGGISLYGVSSQSISYKAFPLERYPMILTYQEDLWQPATIEDGTVVILASKTVQFCTVRAVESGEPKGAYKSTAAVGKLTYEIYGYFDEGIGLFIREYIYASGLSGVDPNLKPFFVVTIPADNSFACILDVSDLLSSLAPKTP